jgi:hypothetical protein
MVSKLRRLLKKHGKSELAVVKAGNIPHATPELESRHAHVHSLLYDRLARVLVDEAGGS